ncbi:hypothetical protein MTO96_008877 [Rhipicephalus appendiculatus]
MSEPSEPSRSPTSSSFTKDETSHLRKSTYSHEDETSHLSKSTYSHEDETSHLKRTKSSGDGPSLQRKASSTSVQSTDYANKDAAVTFRIYLAAAVGALALTVLLVSVLTIGSPVLGEQREGPTTDLVYHMNMRPRMATERITARSAPASPSVKTTADKAEMETIGNINFLDFPVNKRRRSWKRPTRSSSATRKTGRARSLDNETQRRPPGRDTYVQTPKAGSAAGTTVVPPWANVGDGRARSDEARHNNHRPVPTVGAGPKKPTESTSHPRPSPIKTSVPAGAAKSPRPTESGKPPPQAIPGKPPLPVVHGELPPPNVHGKPPQPAVAGKLPPAVAGEPSTVSSELPHAPTAGKLAVAGGPPLPAVVGRLPIPVPTERPHRRDREQTKAATSEAKPQPEPRATTTPGGASGTATGSSVAVVGHGGAGGRYVVENEQTPGPVVKTSDVEEYEYGDDDDDGMSFEEGMMPPRLSRRGDEEGDHGVEHGHRMVRQPTPSPGKKAPPYLADVTPGDAAEAFTYMTDAATSAARKMETSGDYDDDKPGIVGGLKKDQALQWDKRKALLLCTVGSTLTDEAVYPVKERLCDHYVFTHVTVLGSELGTNYGISAYMTFRKLSVKESQAANASQRQSASTRRARPSPPPEAVERRHNRSTSRPPDMFNLKALKEKEKQKQEAAKQRTRPPCRL